MIESTEVNAFFQGIVKQGTVTIRGAKLRNRSIRINFKSESKTKQVRFEVRNLFTEILARSKNHLGLSFENDEAQISLFPTERYGIVH